MKTALLFSVFVLGCGLTVHALTSDDAYRISSYLMQRYASTPDWTDVVCVGGEYDEAEPEFPTAESLFRCAFPSNRIGFGLSPQQVQAAFDQFLTDLASTNRLDVSERYAATGGKSLIFCAETGYANGLHAATSILSRASAPCSGDALLLVTDMAYPTWSMNNLLYSVITNHSRFSLASRNRLFDVYADRVAAASAIDGETVTNSVSMLRSASQHVWGRVSLDKLLCARIQDYPNSSNRLEYASAALAQNGAIRSECEYFTSVTNLLLSTGQPLPPVMLPSCGIFLFDSVL